MEMLLIRHGETDWNRDWKYLGSTDIPLNDTGKKQAAGISDKVRNEKVDYVVCSDLTRCRQTADIIGFEQDINYSARIREMDFGIIEGLTYQQIKAQHPEVIDNWDKNWFEYQIPDGESFFMVRKRVVETIEELKKTGHKKIAVVSHGGVIRSILAYYIANNDPEAFHKFSIENATITRLFFSEKYVSLKSLNEI